MLFGPLRGTPPSGIWGPEAAPCPCRGLLGWDMMVWQSRSGEPDPLWAPLHLSAGVSGGLLGVFCSSHTTFFSKFDLGANIQNLGASTADSESSRGLRPTNAGCNRRSVPTV